MVSVRTLCRYLHKSGLSARVSARKPLLSKLQVKLRILWCKAYSSFEATNWNQVIFSNKPSVCIFRSTRRYDWRSKNCRYNSNYTSKTIKYGGISLLVWGVIRNDGQRILDSMSSKAWFARISTDFRKRSSLNGVYARLSPLSQVFDNNRILR